MSVETPDYAAMLKRMIRAYGRRVGQADVEDLADMLDVREVLDQAIADAVTAQREDLGRSWGAIAIGLGTTRQGAQQRYGSRNAG